MRKRTVTLRLNDEEYNKLHVDSSMCGRKMEPYLRALIMKNKLTPRPSGDWVALSRELSMIGNNINQIARVANMNRNITTESLEEVHKLQMAIWRKVKDI